MLEIRLRNTIINSIPVLELYRENMEHSHRPVLIIFHGFNSSKERKLQQAYMAAAKGLFVVLPDAVRHGEREDTAFAALSYEQKTEFLFDIVEETAGELNTLLNHYRQQSFMDVASCGLIGSSMGGMIIYEYVSRFGIERLRACSVIISSPDFGSIIDHNLEKASTPNLLSQSEIQRIKAKQPLPSILRLRDFPLYLLNAEDDPIMPIQPVRSLYAALHKSYEKKEAVKMHTYRDTGHQTTPGMMKESVDWMREQLM